jgi:hypothetical protein
MSSPCYLSVNPPINFLTPQSIFIKHGMYIMTLEPNSLTYFINPSHHTVSVCVPPVIARQRLGKNVSAATNTHTTTEDLLDASFSMRSVSHQRNVCH